MKYNKIIYFTFAYFWFVSYQAVAQCSGITLENPSSLIPNPSLDERTCCPDGVTPSGQQMSCIVGHIQASIATIDYHVSGCGGSLNHSCLTRIPSGTPDNNGFLGMVYNFGWKEYLGTCLRGNLLPNVDYTLKFQLGFGRSRGGTCVVRDENGNDIERPVATSFSPVEFSIFGTQSCSALPFASTICPLSVPNWVELGSATVRGNDEWVDVTIEFTVPTEISAVAIGPSCAPPLGDNYFYMDNLFLNESREFEVEPIIKSNGHPCSGLNLSVDRYDNLSYQWFYNGRPIRNATSHTYRPPVGQEGNYSVRLSLGSQCVESRDFSYELPFFETQLNEEICFGESFEVGTQSFAQTGDYTVNLSDRNGCDSIVYLSLKVRDRLEVTHEILQPILCAGETAIVEFSSNAEQETYIIDSTNTSITTALYAGDYDIRVKDGFGCVSASYSFLVTEPDSLKASFYAIDETCVGYNDGVVVIDSIKGGVHPYRYGFTVDTLESYNSGDSVLGLSPNHYLLFVLDTNDCILNLDFSISPRPPAILDILIPKEMPIGDSVILDFSTSPPILTESWFWQSGVEINCDTCQNPILKPLYPNNNHFVQLYLVEQVVGCKYEIMERFKVTDGIYIANSFTPNGDGINDVFYIQGFEESVISVETIEIFNRWNELVFSNSDFSINDILSGWNGIFKREELPPSIYYYVATIRLITEEIIQKKGVITLIR